MFFLTWPKFFLLWLRFFRAFFLSCKANASVKLTKTVHGPHSSTLVLFVLFGCYLCCSMYCLCVNVYCHRVTTQLLLINISYHIRTALFWVITQHNSVDFLPTFRVNLSVTSSGVKNPKKVFFGGGYWTPEDGAAQAWNHTNPTFSFTLFLSPSKWNFWTFGERIYLLNLVLVTVLSRPSQWPCCLRSGSAAARLLGLRVRIASRTLMSISYECCEVEFSASGRLLVQRSSTEGVCVLLSLIWKPQKIRRLRPELGVAPREKRKLCCLVIRYELWLTLSGMAYRTSNACVSAFIWNVTRRLSA
jgi:hypothetical protein